MYKADGFDLSKSSYEMLKEFSALGDGEVMTLTGDKNTDTSVPDRLLALELIKERSWGDGKASLAITQLGRDFIEDYAEEARLREEERKRRERFEWKVTV